VKKSTISKSTFFSIINLKGQYFHICCSVYFIPLSHRD